MTRAVDGNNTASEVADEVLVERLRGGDAGAGDALVLRFHVPLIRYLHRLAGSLHLAEELHQQTWVSALEHLGQFHHRPGERGVGFKSWLFRIATNKANDHWRRSRRERGATPTLKVMAEEEAPDSSSRLDAREQDQKLRAAVDALPAAQREVVMMRYYANMKFVEIAETLGCPLNTALGRMHKAVLKLRQSLEPLEVK